MLKIFAHTASLSTDSCTHWFFLHLIAKSVLKNFLNHELCLFQITEFVLDNCRSTNIVGLTDEYVALVSLSLINVGLTSLKGFPKLPNLKKVRSL